MSEEIIDLKKRLLKICNEFVNNRLQTIKTTITSNQNALTSETKSSAGDKHETGRAMLQLEMEKAGKQLRSIKTMKETLAKIDVSKTAKNAHLGSIIYTNTNAYFLSVAVGQIILDNSVIFAVSVSSPIGRILLGKQENDVFLFNGNTITIEKIV